MENLQADAQTKAHDENLTEEATNLSSKKTRPQASRPGSIGDASQLFGGGGGELDDFFGPQQNSAFPSQSPAFGPVAEEPEPITRSINNGPSDPFSLTSANYQFNASSSTNAQDLQGVKPSNDHSTDPNDFYLFSQGNTAQNYPDYESLVNSAVPNNQLQPQGSFIQTTYQHTDLSSQYPYHSEPIQNQKFSDSSAQNPYINNSAVGSALGVSNQPQRLAPSDYNPYEPAHIYGAQATQSLANNVYDAPTAQLQDAIPRAASVGAYSLGLNSGIGNRPSMYLRSNTTHTLTEQPSAASLSRPKVYDAYDPPAIRKKKPVVSNAPISLPSSPALGDAASTSQFGPGPLASKFQSQLPPPPPKQRSISGPIPAASGIRSMVYHAPNHDASDFYPKSQPSIYSEISESSMAHQPLGSSPNVSNFYDNQGQSNSLSNKYAPLANQDLVGSTGFGSETPGAFSYKSQDPSYSVLNSSNPYSTSPISRVDDPYAPVNPSGTSPDALNKQSDPNSNQVSSASEYMPLTAPQPLDNLLQPESGSALPPLITPNKSNSLPYHGSHNDVPKPPSPNLYGPTSPVNRNSFGASDHTAPPKSSSLRFTAPVGGIEDGSTNESLTPEATFLSSAIESATDYPLHENVSFDPLEEISNSASRLSLSSPPLSKHTSGLSDSPIDTIQPVEDHLQIIQYTTDGGQISAPQIPIATKLSVPAVHVQPATPEFSVIGTGEAVTAGGFDVLADLGGDSGMECVKEVSKNSYQTEFTGTETSYGFDGLSNLDQQSNNVDYNHGSILSNNPNSNNSPFSPQSHDDAFSQSYNPYEPQPKNKSLCSDSDLKQTDGSTSPLLNSNSQTSFGPQATQFPFLMQSPPLSYGVMGDSSRLYNLTSKEVTSELTSDNAQYVPSAYESPYASNLSHKDQLSAYHPDSQTAYKHPEQSTDPMLQRLEAKIPVATFGFGGKLVTVFPGGDSVSSGPAQTGFEDPYQSTSGFGSGSGFGIGTTVKVQQLSNIIPSAELQSYPGPLFMDGNNKSSSGRKRKEASQWLDKKLNESEQELTFVLSIASGNCPGPGMIKNEAQDKKVMEVQDKILLIKLLKVLLENEGKLAGTPKVEEAVRMILHSSGTNSSAEPPAISLQHSLESHATIRDPKASATLSDIVATYSVRGSTLEDIQASFSDGNRPKALKIAVDHKMWAHALVIANSLGGDTWRDTVREFVRFELSDSESNFPEAQVNPNQSCSGRESLRVLYNLFAGAGAGALEEFLPPSHSIAPPAAPFALNPESYGLPPAAAMNLQGMTLSASRVNSPAPTPQLQSRKLPTNVPDYVLKQWQPTVALTVANRVAGSTPFLVGLGDLLLNNGRVYAAHVTYLLSNGSSVFSTFENGDRITLLGDNGLIGDEKPGLNVEAVMFTEVLELALSLVHTVKNQDPFIGIPHLQAYKLGLCLEYAAHGIVDIANRYCEALAGTIKLASKPCPYYHTNLLEQLKVVSDRLLAAPVSEKGSSWISRKMPRPMLDNVWQTLEGRVHKFVAGEDDPVDPSGSNQNPLSQGKALGPFSHYSSISPANTSGTLSRVQSSSDLAYPNNQSISSTARPFQNSTPFQRPSSGADYSSPYEKDPRQRSTSAMMTYDSSCSSPVNWDPFGESKNDSQSQSLLNGGSQTTPQSFVATSSTTETFHQEGNSSSGQGGWWEAASQHGTPAISSQPALTSVDDPTITEDSSGFIDPMASFGMPAFDPTGSKSETHAHVSHHAPNSLGYDEEEDDLGFGNSSSRKRQQSLKDDPSENASSQDTETPEKSSSNKLAAKIEDKTLKSAPSSSWLGRWFKRETTPGSTGSGPVKANLGEEVSLVYDPESKRWINKKAGQSSSPKPGAPPPPPVRAQTASPTSSMRTDNSPSSEYKPPIPAMTRMKTMDAGAGRSSLDSQNFGPPPSRSTNPSPDPGSISGITPPISKSANSTAPPPISSNSKKPATKKNIRSRYVEIR
ncbi:Sec23-binding domain of Sec16-domain-containing protein [Phakopsora pachyrhizi]|uniref:Protein transport protein sec16 n=1 Tax=Phakopsora pachyrhizi TaxID=170000 RepID=A0AAV0AFF7_PHAPC|nr:Sec23-binding domain of Sec16-domain-containing protein [Phakopsora pachyrhizi]